jgi:redox-sensitive bicupin YhaK (pirin superfamily)
MRLVPPIREIVQLWVNLPSRWKMSPPKTVTKLRKDLPGFRGRGANSSATCTPISGDWFNDFGPFEPITDVALALVDIDAGGRFEFAVDAGKVAIVYVVKGSVVVGDANVAEFSVVEFNDDGDSVVVASNEGARIVVGHGSATGEPVVSVGPFVMNTEEEIRQAIFDARSGRIGR